MPSFAKVAKGLWDMYRAEVLAKVPVVQHCRFGDVALRWVDREGGEEELPSSGDGREEDAGEEGLEREEAGLAQGITPAPWAAAGGALGTSGSGVRPLPPPSRLGASTTISSSASSASTAFGRRQHPSSFPLPPHTSTAPRTSFQPPTLFPSRAPHTAPPPRTPTTMTLADQGGAAAASSPFGILPRVGLGSDAVLERGGGAGRERAGEEGESGTRAPWAQ